MFRVAIIFIGGIITGASLILGLNDKDDSAWEEYRG